LASQFDPAGGIAGKSRNGEASLDEKADGVRGNVHREHSIDSALIQVVEEGLGEAMARGVWRLEKVDGEAFIALDRPLLGFPYEKGPKRVHLVVVAVPARVAKQDEASVGKAGADKDSHSMPKIENAPRLEAGQDGGKGGSADAELLLKFAERGELASRPQGFCLAEQGRRGGILLAHLRAHHVKTQCTGTGSFPQGGLFSATIAGR
jgi:hypothetical protein